MGIRLGSRVGKGIPVVFQDLCLTFHIPQPLTELTRLKGQGLQLLQFFLQRPVLFLCLGQKSGAVVADFVF